MNFWSGAIADSKLLESMLRCASSRRSLSGFATFCGRDCVGCFVGDCAKAVGALYSPGADCRASASTTEQTGTPNAWLRNRKCFMVRCQKRRLQLLMPPAGLMI